MADERCKTSGKVRYPTKQAAWKVIEEKQRKFRGGKGRQHKTFPKGSHGEVGAYQCPDCKSYHISSSTGGQP